MSDFDSLREDLNVVMEAMNRYSGAVAHYVDVSSDQIRDLWADNAELRDELHALANRVESLTRARLTEPAEVAEAMVQPYPVCVCGHRYDHHDGTAGCHHKMTCGCLDYEPRGIVRERQR